jgi:hypothetical protein
MHTCRSEHVGSTARMATMPRRPHHQAAACTDATAHPRRGKRRTTACTSYSARSPGRCRPHRPVRHPDITAPSPLSCLPFAPSTRHTSCRHSTHLALGAVKALFRFARLRGLGRKLRHLRRLGFFWEKVDPEEFQALPVNHFVIV